MRKLLRGSIGPTRITSAATILTKIVDLAIGVTYGGEAQVCIFNNSGTPCYWAYGVPTAGTPAGTPNLTTNSGLELPAGATLILDDIGGAQVWVIAGSGTFDLRVTGVYS